MKSEQWTEFISALANIARGNNAAREEDEEKGQGADVLCLTIAEDGSGTFGRVISRPELEVNGAVSIVHHEIEAWLEGSDAKELGDCIWLYDEPEAEKAERIDLIAQRDAATLKALLAWRRATLDTIYKRARREYIPGVNASKTAEHLLFHLNLLADAAIELTAGDGSRSIEIACPTCHEVLLCGDWRAKR